MTSQHQLYRHQQSGDNVLAESCFSQVDVGARNLLAFGATKDEVVQIEKESLQTLDGLHPHIKVTSADEAIDVLKIIRSVGL